MRKVTIIICLTAALLVSGCATIMNGPYQQIPVTSIPPGAIVTTTNYNSWVRTPGILKIERANSTILTARLDGYEPAKQKLEAKLSPWIFGNGAGTFSPRIIGAVNGILASLIVDLASGSACELTPKEVHFKLIPMQ
jgi:uncharacterized protein YceK